MTIQRYVLGFAFNSEMSYVLLVKKLKNIGKWNGVGGKVEIGELPQDAMLREFEEETGLAVKWERMGTVVGEEWTMCVFKSTGLPARQFQTVNDVGEPLMWAKCHVVTDQLVKHRFAQNVPTMVSHAVSGTGLLRIRV